MSYHIVFSMPDASIYDGPGDDPPHTFETFEDAKAAAIDDLERWRNRIDGNLEELHAAKSISDLSYHQEH